MEVSTFNKDYSINVNIDDYPFIYFFPYTIFQACLEKRIVIPHFCYHSKLKIAGNCRACFVEEKKTVKPVISCASTIYSGSEIHTTTQLVLNSRESTLEYLLINHPLDCPICDQGGECDLQDQSVVYGNDVGRFYEFKKRAVENKNYTPLIKFFLNRCIHCARCTRFSHDISGSYLISLLGRGYDSEISAYTYKFFVDEVSGNMIDLCPVGALTSKPYAFSARIWEIFDIHYFDIFDSLNSNIKLEIRGSAVIRVLPVVNDYVNGEWISDKIRFNYDSYNKQRLLFCTIILNKKFYYYSWFNTFFYCKNYFFNTVQNLKRTRLKCFNLHNSKGRFLSLDSSVSIKRFFYLLSSNDYGNIVGDGDFRRNFLPIKKFYNLDKNVAGESLKKYVYGFLLFSVNTRFESPIFNLKVKEIINNVDNTNTSAFAFSFGFSFNNNFYLNCLGNNLYFLINKISELSVVSGATIPFVEKVIFIILGSKINILDPYVKFLLQIFIKKFGNVDINFIHICGNASFHSLKEIGCSTDKKVSTGLNLKYYPFTFISFGGDYFYNLKNSLLNLNCYFGHHDNSFLKFFNLILPIKFFYERSLSYVNSEGYFQKGGILKIDYRYHFIKSEKNILDMFGKIFNIYSYRSNFEKFYCIGAIAPQYSKLLVKNFSNSLIIYNFLINYTGVKSLFFINAPSLINDYFLSDFVSKNSIVMSLCSKKFTLFNDFMYIYLNGNNLN